jgi:hypothetical protein
MVELMSLFPQLDTACAALSYCPEAELASIGTDGEVIRFSPLWLLRRYQLSPTAVRRGYLHMLLHCLYLHPFSGQEGRRWDLAYDIAVERIIEGAAQPRLALEEDPVRTACFHVLGDQSPSAEEVYGMLEQKAFPFSLEEMEGAFRFDDHSLWAGDPNSCGQLRRRWENLASGAGRGGSRRGRTAGSGVEVLSAPCQGAYDYRRFLSQFTVSREELQLDLESFDQNL